MKDFLKKLIAAKTAEINEARSKMKASEDLAEVRSLGEKLEALQEELRDAQDQLAKIEAEEARSAAPAFEPMKAIQSTVVGEARSADTDDLGTMEYRTAFMNYVQRGVKSDILKFEQRASAGTSADLGVLLPSTVVQEIIEGVSKVYGQLYSRVKKTNIPGGVKYPIGSFSATFNRITEAQGASARQHAGEISGYVEFSYNIGEIRLARTLLQTVLSVPVFEQEFANVIVEAYIKAMDKEIMIGSAANNQCEGILTEAAKSNSRIPAANIIEFTAADVADWTKWQEKLFAKIPLSMRGLRPEFVMTANTYESNIKTLKDSNNRPLYNETFNPVNGSEICTFKGKQVALVEEDILGNFNDINVDGDGSKYFGMYWVPEKAYAINSNLDFSVIDYFDQETNQHVKKAIVINDGKVLDPKYIYLLKKVAPSA